MIRIHKGDAPSRLVDVGAAATQAMLVEYDADPDAFRTGGKRFDPDSGIYAMKAIKQALKDSHHEKCCYCETKIEDPFAFGHVEHYRPKKAVVQDRLSSEERPGYYWLAYDWQNLLLSCHFCNSTNKGNLFPLEVPVDRARSHHDDLSREAPLLVKPDEDDDIGEHIDFLEDIPIGLTDKGIRTIDVLRLDSVRHARRLSHYNALAKALDIVMDLHDSPDPRARMHAAKFRSFLESSTLEASEYSALSRRFLADHPLP